MGSFEAGFSVRQLSFAGADVTAVSPVLSWDAGGRWRLEGRYSYSYSRFTATGLANGDHSVVARAKWRGWRRITLNGSYAYGIESFEDLTADRIGALGASTAAGGVSIRLRSMTVIDSIWERQWRSNDSTLNRLTVSLARFFP